MVSNDRDDPGRMRIWYLILLYFLFEFDISLSYPYGRPHETFYLHLTLIDTLVPDYLANK